MLGAWSPFIFSALIIVGWLIIAGFWPIHKPLSSPQDVATFFRTNLFRIRFGLVVAMFGSAFFIPFTSTLSYFVSQIEGRTGPLTFWVLLGGFANTLFGFYPQIWWLVEAYRPEERSEEIISFFNDFIWINLIGAATLVYMMFLGVGVASLVDKKQPAIFPRWFGYFSIFVVLANCPAQALYFFKSGPFAWNGLFSFYLPFTTFFVWILSAGLLMRSALIREHSQILGIS